MYFYQSREMPAPVFSPRREERRRLKPDVSGNVLNENGSGTGVPVKGKRKEALPGGSVSFDILCLSARRGERIPVGTYGHVCRTHDLAVLADLLQPVRAPAGDTGDGEDRCVELHGQSKHLIYKSAVEIHVGADTM